MARIALTPLLVLISLALIRPIGAATGTIKDVEHVVLFMQENRSFDHVSFKFLNQSLYMELNLRKYFGTMAGVRGFGDPNVHIASDGRPVWFQ